MNYADVTQRHENNQRARAFLQLALAKAATTDNTSAAMLLERRLGETSPYLPVLQKAAVDPTATTGEPDDLLRPFGRAFLELLRGRSAYDSIRFVPAPLATRVSIEPSTDDVAEWVSETAPIPVHEFNLGDFTSLSIGKLAAIDVFTAEVTRSAEPEAINTIERRITRNLSASTDRAAFLPTLAGSLAFGATEVTATADVSDDVRDLLWSLSDGVASRPAFVLGASAARVLVFSGDPIFRDVALIGAGAIGNVPTFTSLSPSLKNYAVAVDADGILTFDGGIVLDRSMASTIELDDAPSGSGTLTSLFQKNLVGIRSLRYLAWAKRSDAVAYLDLTEAGSPS